MKHLHAVNILQSHTGTSSDTEYWASEDHALKRPRVSLCCVMSVFGIQCLCHVSLHNGAKQEAHRKAALRTSKAFISNWEENKKPGEKVSKQLIHFFLLQDTRSWCCTRTCWGCWWSLGCHQEGWPCARPCPGDYPARTLARESALGAALAECSYTSCKERINRLFK